jgi:DNA-binding transcriptional LysR family regulator
VFRAVAQEKSFSRGARTVFRTQPAVSQAVKLLEREVGAKLFLRQGRTIELTQAGRILLEHVNEAFDSLERAQARIEALKELRSGTLKIAASDTTACHVLPGTLEPFRRAYPGVEIDISNRPSPVAAQQVVDHQADLAVVTLPIDHPKLTSEPLIVREDVAVCAPDHPLAKRRRISLAQLAVHPLLLLDRGSNTRGFIDAQFQTAGLSPTIAMELGSIEVICRLVQLDFGVSIVPRIAVEDAVKEGKLHSIRVFEKAQCRTLGIVYPATGIANLAAQVFARMLREDLKKGEI